MRRRSLSLVLFGLIGLVFIQTTWAQESNLIPYTWADVGLTISYPADWDEPLPGVSDDGRLTLSMAQTLVDSPDARPPGIPIITLSILPPSAPVDDFTPLMTEELDSLSITVTPTDISTSTLAGQDGQSAEGVSDDGLLLGFARATALPDGTVLLVTGRAPEARRVDFTELFNAVADSITLDEVSSTARPIYGVVWNTTRTVADGDDAFVTLTGAAYRDGKLYAVDMALGVVELDAKTGTVLANYPNPDFQLPSSIAVDADGVVYVADPVCQCIQILDTDGTWRDAITDFDIESPASILVTSDGTLYATELTDSGIQVRLISENGENAIAFGPEVVAQPLLALGADGQVLALTPDGVVLAVSEEDLAPLATLDTGQIFITDFAVDTSGNFILTTEGLGILIVSPDGEPVDGLGRIVANFPLPGEFVHPSGVVVGDDGTIYVVDSDGSFGSVTAMNRNISAGRIGSTVLIPGVAVQGVLDESTTQQDWTLDGVTGQLVTISAVDATGTGALDVSLELIAPDGSVEAQNDDQEGVDLAVPVDAQIPNHVLAATGNYTVRVKAVDGSGPYNLGIVQDLSFSLNSDGSTEIDGKIEDALPKQRWTFEGTAGQVFTITMGVTSGTLDPLVRLLDADGNVLAENDDADDPELGKNAQIVQVTLPADGLYTLEAARFEGEGDYVLLIVATS